MITRLLLGITLVLANPALAQTADAPTAEPPAPELTIIEERDVTLDQFLWTARPIVVFADAKADPRFVEQMRFLQADIPELLERDVVVLIDTNRGGKTPLREALRPRGFMLVLIDKDGGVKLRKPAPWTVREITRSIDKWPTRQQEIRVDLGKE
jgi:hypothetical protein